jgi:hypothetical protein
MLSVHVCFGNAFGNISTLITPAVVALVAVVLSQLLRLCFKSVTWKISEEVARPSEMRSVASVYFAMMRNGYKTLTAVSWPDRTHQYTYEWERTVEWMRSGRPRWWHRNGWRAGPWSAHPLSYIRTAFWRWRRVQAVPSVTCHSVTLERSSASPTRAECSTFTNKVLLQGWKWLVVLVVVVVVVVEIILQLGSRPVALVLH